MKKLNFLLVIIAILGVITAFSFFNKEGYAINVNSKNKAIVEKALTGEIENTDNITKIISHEKEEIIVEVKLNESTYLILLTRYKELFQKIPPDDGGDDVPPYDVKSSLLQTSSDKIDYEYMDSKFKKYVKEIQINGKDGELVYTLLNEVRKSFAFLNQDDQKIANIIIHEIQSGDLVLNSDSTFIDILNSYKNRKRDDNIREFSERRGIPEDELRKFVDENNNYNNINEYGRLDNLLNITSLDKTIKYYFEHYNQKLNNIKARKKLIDELKAFIDSNCMIFDN